MTAQLPPLLFSEGGPPPVILPSLVLRKDIDPECFPVGPLGLGDVCLELYRIGTGVGRSIDEGVSRTKAAVVAEPDFGDKEALLPFANSPSLYAESDEIFP